ncbi:hypothetical protein M0R89_03710 [Halorussus limi]|uniref:Uncharacterized protein n=1 Tax=Halorussus limi TaxID=2938695 RepID=A0A8U0HVS6_9EURY|nr:hypothetical protein [Halorussus limi]UPV75182.1 hypothetical protein M0R89_03710 [Halorussus limi]
MATGPLPLVSQATVRAVGLGALAGAAYLSLVVGTMRAVYPSFSVREQWLSSLGDLRGLAYAFGGLWFVGTVAAALFVRFGAILPLAVLAFDYLVFVADPFVGDVQGPPALLLWVIYVPVLLLLGGAEYGSLVVASGGPPPVVALRNLAVGAVFLALVGRGLAAYLPVWRVLSVSHSLPVRVENDGGSPHCVEVTVFDATDETPVFTDRVRVEAGTTVALDDAITELGRYRIEAALPDGTTDEYVFEPRRRFSVIGVVVWVEGELGRLTVVGQGSGP